MLKLIRTRSSKVWKRWIYHQQHQRSRRFSLGYKPHEPTTSRTSTNNESHPSVKPSQTLIPKADFFNDATQFRARQVLPLSEDFKKLNSVLTFTPGDTTLLIGATGTGKTTILAQLVSSFAVENVKTTVVSAENPTSSFIAVQRHK